MIFGASQRKKENKTYKGLFYRLRYICSCKCFIQLFGEFQCPYQALAFRCPNSNRWKLKLFYRLETGEAVNWNRSKKGKKNLKPETGHSWISEDFSQDCIIDHALLVDRESWSLRLSLQGVIIKAFHILDVWKGLSEILTC